jgi:hypothetical protein
VCVCVCVCSLSQTVQYFKYLYKINELYYICNKQSSILLLAIFVNVLIFIIFKLNCILGTSESQKSRSM